jgi:hypothetical protein
MQVFFDRPVPTYRAGQLPGTQGSRTDVVTGFDLGRLVALGPEREDAPKRTAVGLPLGINPAAIGDRLGVPYATSPMSAFGFSKALVSGASAKTSSRR